MDYVEFWLLDTAIWGAPYLDLIDGDDRFLRLQWNKPSHHLQHDELVGWLEKLLGSGYIEFYRGETVVIPSRSDLASGLRQHRHPAPLCYALTVSGGARWEEMAGPDWERFFVDQWSEEDHERVLEITAASSSTLDSVLEHGPRFWEITILKEIKERRVIQPWEAMYWKTLPQGHRLTLSYSKGLPAEMLQMRPGEPKVECFADQRRLFRELRKWYRSPWERED